MSTSTTHDTRADIQQLAVAIYSPLFNELDNIKDAYAYAQKIARASDNPAAVMTAVHVLLNTVAKTIERINDTAQPTTEGA